jgi:hypothetical protein
MIQLTRSVVAALRRRCEGRSGEDRAAGESDGGQ